MIKNYIKTISPPLLSVHSILVSFPASLLYSALQTRSLLLFLQLLSMETTVFPRENPTNLHQSICSSNISKHIGEASSTSMIFGEKPVNLSHNKRWIAWQDTEEEEFDWGELIPSSRDHSQRNGLASSSTTAHVEYSVPNNLVPAAAAVVPAVLSSPSLSTHGSIIANNFPMINAFSNPIPQVHSSMSMLNAPSSSKYLQGRGLPPLPLRPFPPALSQTIPMSHNPVPISFNPHGGGAFSGFISSLMDEDLLSFRNQAPLEDPVPLDFNPDFLKIRHESVINALYADLPRQCRSCGLRFKSQEQHNKHMDWHVSKNRSSSSHKWSRKEKPSPISRIWYASAAMWLPAAEALGTEEAPRIECVANKKDDQEFAVPADYDQITCALCGERFDDFYSEETEDWMYKGAVYMNAAGVPTGGGMDRSQLGPIVHAKCRF